MSIYGVRYEKIDPSRDEKADAHRRGGSQIEGSWSIPADTDEQLKERIAEFLASKHRLESGKWRVTSVARFS